MDSKRKVLLFVVSSFILYLLISLFSYVLGIDWAPLKRINLLSDIVKETPIKSKDTLANAPLIVVAAKPDYNINFYQLPHFITNFNTDTTQPSLTGFSQKLHDLKTRKKRKVRIAYFGDSMIEGDLLTQTIRKLLQKEFGGSGVGFVPVTSMVSQFRQTVNTSASEGWSNDNFKTPGKKNKLFLSGYLFHSQGDWVEMRDQTITDSVALIEKSLLCGYSAEPVTVKINNNPVALKPVKIFNRIVTSTDLGRSIRLSIADTSLPVYGISFESESGITVDNFSFRGITGIEYGYLDSAFLSKIAEANPYDLIVFQYGVNLLFRPNDKNFNWYGRVFEQVTKKFRSCFPTADFVIVSTADRAFRYQGEYKSAIGIDSLIKLQAAVAYQTGSCFYNQFETMGGHNSIVDWASRKPSLANKDYVHPNHRGAEILGQYFFEAIMDDYRKYVTTKH
ncbi:MAG: hypothetical protein ABIQ31_25040 [Ferruginibacter sp.]